MGQNLVAAVFVMRALMHSWIANVSARIILVPRSDDGSIPIKDFSDGRSVEADIATVDGPIASIISPIDIRVGISPEGPHVSIL